MEHLFGPALQSASGQVVAADLAVPDRDQRLPARDREPRPAAAALGPWCSGRRPGRRAGPGPAGDPVAAADPGRADPPRPGRPGGGRGDPGERAAGAGRRAAVPARPWAAGRADPAGRARLARGRGRRPARDHADRREQPAAAGQGAAAAGGPGHGRGPANASQASQRALLDAYAEAFSNADVGALTKLLREDAVLEMPPQPTWFAGREQVGQPRLAGAHRARQVRDDRHRRQRPARARRLPARLKTTASGVTEFRSALNFGPTSGSPGAS